MHERLIHELLSFTKYRASSSSPAETHEFATKIPTTTLLINKNPLAWATSKDVEDGISRAVEEAARSDGVLANQVYFCNELLYMASEERIGTVQKNNEQKLARRNGITLDTKYIMWVVNLTATPQDILNNQSGSHWCVVLVDLYHPVGEVHNTYPNVYARVRFFDPMGGSITRRVDAEIRRLLDEQLPGNLLRINNENYGDMDPQLTLHISETINLGWRLQADGVQCGFWCIWFAHQFMLTGVLDPDAWHHPPNPTNTTENQLAFRAYYFHSSDGDKPVGKKRMRPVQQPARFARVLKEEPDDAQSATGSHGKNKLMRPGTLAAPIELDSDSDDARERRNPGGDKHKSSSPSEPIELDSDSDDPPAGGTSSKDPIELVDSDSGE